jgi:nucleotide-binding universal stress UspA family protein
LSNKIKGRFSKILVTIDGSQPSIDAADYAIEIAKKDNPQLIALTVLDISTPRRFIIILYYSTFLWIKGVGRR